MQTELNTFLGKVSNPDLDSETIEIRYKSKNGRMESFFSNDLEKINRKVEELKSDNDIYFGVAPRKNNDTGKKENCSSISSFWVDIDCGQDGHKKKNIFMTKEDAFKYINNAPIKPSILVDSGHGYHLYFLLNEKILLNDNGINLVENINRQLSLIYGGDSVQNIDRIMRLPDTLNHKTTPAVPCKVIDFNNDKRYSIELLGQVPLLSLDLGKIKTLSLTEVNLYELIFGKNLDKLNKISRSEIDQAIIIKLISSGISHQEIELIFENFPTSGKYKDHDDPETYLNHSITKAQEFLNKKFVLDNLNNNHLNYKKYYEVISDDNVCIKDFHHQEMTNFVLRINQIIKRVRDGNIESKLKGNIYFENKVEIPFYDVSADILFDTRAFKKMINHLAPTKPIIKTKYEEMLEAINYLNREAEQLEEKEFGYNDSKTEYLTPALIISKDKFIEQDTPIKYSEIWGHNKIGFEIADEAKLQAVKRIIIEKLLKWDDPVVIYSSIAFTMLPIVQPHIAKVLPNKFFLMLRGNSGSGKTHLARNCQNFYGDFQNLVSWTSTDTSINIIGNAFKDALFVVDDFKKQNFKNDNSIKQAMAIVQNYSDGTGRLRANIDLDIKDERFIKGWLLLSAEDIVFSESSTIARGIIVPVASKEFKPKEARELLEMSKDFKCITSSFIQYVLQDNVKEQIKNRLENNIDFFQNTTKNASDISLDNIGRIINNFALLKTSWDIFSSFLFDNESEKDIHNRIYEPKLKELFLENVLRIDDSKSEKIFEQTLWAMVDSKRLYFERLRLEESDPFQDTQRGIKIGEYYLFRDSEIRICLNLNTAYKEIIKYNPDIQITLDTLTDKLLKLNKIITNNSKRVYFAQGKHGYGVRWIGKFPSSLFGISEDPTALETAENIIFDNFTGTFFREENPELPAATADFSTANDNPNVVEF